MAETLRTLCTNPAGASRWVKSTDLDGVFISGFLVALAMGIRAHVRQGTSCGQSRHSQGTQILKPLKESQDT